METMHGHPLNDRADELRKIVLQKVKVGQNVKVPIAMLERSEFRILADYLGDIGIVQWKTYMVGLPEEIVVVEWPGGWWQALKAALPGYLGRLVRRLSPVRMDRKEVTVFPAVCPHVGLPQDRMVHLDWLASQERKKPNGRTKEAGH